MSDAKKTAIIVSATLVGFLILCALVYLANALDGGESEARREAQKAVRAALDSRVRHTADFSIPVAEKATLAGAPVWRVVGYVTVTNAFNAEVRHGYVVILKIKGSSLVPESVVVGEH